MMNEIPELKDDFAFLKKIDSRTREWTDFDGPKTKRKEKVRSNFLLHPKRLSSDSESSLQASSPREFLSTGNLKTSNSFQLNNNVCQHIRHYSVQSYQIDTVENCVVETGIGDVGEPKASDTKTLLTPVPKKSSKVRPVSNNENFDKKFKTFSERILKVLTNVRVMIEEGIPLPDGEEDYFRRLKRLQEFTARFSRIYLYPLLRQTGELSLADKMSRTVMNQKFLYAEQLILQGLQAYYSHLPSSVGKCGSDKLRSLLDQITYMCHLYEVLKKDSNPDNWEFLNAMRGHVELLLEALTTFDLKFVDKPKPKTQNEVKKKLKAQDSKVICNKRGAKKLSMYLHNFSHKKELGCRRDVEYLSKKKYSVKSRYKTAGFKHRPPVQKQTSPNLPSTLTLFHKVSSDVKFTPRRTPVREDDIRTMVEIDSALEVPPNTGENLNHENSNATNRHQLVQDGDEIEDPNVEKALEVIRRFFGNLSENKQTDFLEKIASKMDNRKEEIESTQEDHKPKKKLKKPTVTVTGAKNAKLICIRDDDSVEDTVVHKEDKEIMTDVEIKLKSSETQTEIADKRSKPTIKISRLPKNNRRMLTLLPKDYAVNVIQYKLQYIRFHKHNPMYRKSAHIQPWALMGRISDDILDHILQSVTNELEVNEILENLYNAEFQY